MRIKLSPIVSEMAFSVVLAGSVLTINGEAFDFSPMGDGDTLPRSAILSEWFPGEVTKEGGQISLTLLFPIPINYSPEQAFPVDLVDIPDGPVVFPAPLPVTEPAKLTAEVIANAEPLEGEA